MDVAKSKSIVIALLIAFNIFLLVNNLTFVRGQGVRKDTIQNAEIILKQRGVTLESTIPATPDGLRRLEYSYSKLDRQALAGILLGDSYVVTGQEAVNIQGVALVQEYEFEYGAKMLQFVNDTEFVFFDDEPSVGDQSVRKPDLSSDEKLKKAAQQFLEDAGLLDGKYFVDCLERNNDGSATVAFIEEYEGLPVFDNYCFVTLNKDGVVKLEYGKVHVIGFTQESIERFDAYQALLSYFKMGSNLVITAIDSGYKLEDSSMEGVELVEMLPVWRVKIKGSSEPEYLYPYDSKQ